MREENYWTRMLRHKLSRRQALKSGVMASAGIAAASVVGCGGGTPKTDTGTDSGAKQPKAGGTIVTYTTGDPPHFDPHIDVSYRIMGTVGWAMNRLLRYKNEKDRKPGDLEPRPDLAEGWEQTDASTYVFKLRQGVKWHNISPVNGRELTAEDVKWSYDRFAFAKDSPHRYMWEELDSLEVVDKYTVKFKTKNPFAPFLTAIASHFSWIMAHEVVEKYGDGKKNMIGTGPWYLDKYEPTVRYVFKRHPDYFEKGLPYLDGVEYLMIPDPSTSTAGLRAKEIDIGALNDTDLPTFKQGRPDAQYKDYKSVACGHIYWNVNKPPWNDVRVRRAISMAIDRDGWINAMFGGNGDWQTAVPSAFEYFAIPMDQLGEGLKYLKHNVEEAKKLLAEAGFPNGFDVDLHSTPGYGTTHVQMVELVAGFLKDIGIRATIRMKEYALYMQSTFKGEGFEGLAFGPQTPFNEPDDFLYGMYNPGHQRNQVKVDDPKLTPLLIKQRQTLNKEERRKVIWDIEKYLATQQYYVYRPTGFTHGVYQPWVRDYWVVSTYSHEAVYPTWLDK